MKKVCLIASITLAVLLALGLTTESFAKEKPYGAGRRVLIGFKDGTGGQAAEKRKGRVRNLGGDVHHSFHFVPIVSARLSDKMIAKMKTRADVEYVEDDIIMHAIGQETPWGVERIDAPTAWTTSTGADVDVAILDTGIDYDHPDLDDNIAGGVNYTGWRRTDGSTDKRYWNDKNGHGSHCAGIVAAENNDIGVVGVAPEANLWAVKVLNDRGSGYVSDIIQGLEWCAEKEIEVASMSFGGGYSQSLEDACNTANAAGVLLVAAAGNEGTAGVIYPAAHESVIAVSATDDSDNIADFSSVGEQVELAAPGVSIYSTYKNGGYAWGYGTSMACPHVAGTAALAWAGTNTSTRYLLQDTAEDIGLTSEEQGFGLVDAAAATGVPAGEPPVAKAGGPYSADEGSPIPFDASGSSDPDGTIISYEWDFGDGTTGTGASPSHTYADNDTYTVKLTVKDDTGLTGTDTAEATVANVAPTAEAGGPYSGDEGAEITLGGSATDPGADTFTYAWDLDDDGTCETSGQTVSATWITQGAYTVGLRVTDDDGGVGTDTATVNVSDVEPVAAFSYWPASPAEGETVYFRDESTSYDGITWSWAFGDNYTSPDQNPTHSYASAGTYMVTLTVSEADGDSDTATQGITISAAAENKPPVADAGPDQTASVYEIVNFDGSGSSDPDGSIVTYEWDFGDGTAGTGVSVAYAYSSPGTYTVTLTVEDNGGKTAQDTATVTVSETPATKEFTFNGTVLPRKESRHTVTIASPGAESMYVRLTWNGNGWGDLRLRVYNPAGKKVAERDKSSWKNKVEEIIIEGLEPGNWEVAAKSDSRRTTISYTIEGVVNY